MLEKNLKVKEILDWEITKITNATGPLELRLGGKVAPLKKMDVINDNPSSKVTKIHYFNECDRTVLLLENGNLLEIDSEKNISTIKTEYFSAFKCFYVDEESITIVGGSGSKIEVSTYSRDVNISKQKMQSLLDSKIKTMIPNLPRWDEITEIKKIDGRLILGTKNGKIAVIKVADNGVKLLDEIKRMEVPITFIEKSSNGKWILAGNRSYDNPYIRRLTLLEKEENGYSVPGKVEPNMEFSQSKDIRTIRAVKGNIFAVLYNDGKVVFYAITRKNNQWGINAINSINADEKDSVTDFTMLPNGFLVLATEKGAIKIYNLQGKKNNSDNIEKNENDDEKNEGEEDNISPLLTATYQTGKEGRCKIASINYDYFFVVSECEDANSNDNYRILFYRSPLNLELKNHLNAVKELIEKIKEKVNDNKEFHLTLLDLSGIDFSKQQNLLCELIAFLFAKNAVANLNLSDCKLNDDFFLGNDKWVNTIASATRLKKFDLSGNCFTKSTESIRNLIDGQEQINQEIIKSTQKEKNQEELQKKEERIKKIVLNLSGMVNESLYNLSLFNKKNADLVDSNAINNINKSLNLLKPKPDNQFPVSMYIFPGANNANNLQEKNFSQKTQFSANEENKNNLNVAPLSKNVVEPVNNDNEGVEGVLEFEYQNSEKKQQNNENKSQNNGGNVVSLQFGANATNTLFYANKIDLKNNPKSGDQNKNQKI